MRGIQFGISIFFLLTSINVFSQKAELKRRLTEIAATVDGQVGIAIMDLTTKDTLVYNPHGIFPMQSVFKFPIALAVLKKVDDKKLSLAKKIKLTKRDLLPNTWSPLRDKYPDGNVEVALEEILMYMVTHSDNNACDILLRQLGGPKKVNDYVHELGVTEMAIKYNEEEMHGEWDAQFENWSKSTAMLKLLALFYDKKLLSTSSQEILWKMMAETSTGSKRLKGLLPKDTEVLHRTGTGGPKGDINGAVNDVGLVKLANGKYFAIVVFLGRVKGEVSDLERKIAEMTLAAYQSEWLTK